MATPVATPLDPTFTNDSGSVTLTTVSTTSVIGKGQLTIAGETFGIDFDAVVTSSGACGG
jgi:hypothetical protein